MLSVAVSGNLDAGRFFCRAVFLATFEELLEVVTCAVSRSNLTGQGSFPWHGIISIEIPIAS